jgi:hypothetical protein
MLERQRLDPVDDLRRSGLGVALWIGGRSFSPSKPWV